MYRPTLDEPPPFMTTTDEPSMCGAIDVFSVDYFDPR